MVSVLTRRCQTSRDSRMDIDIFICYKIQEKEEKEKEFNAINNVIQGYVEKSENY